MANNTEILLISETFLKDNSAVSDNVAGKFLRSAIREAQEVYFRAILGDALLDKVKDLVREGTIGREENAAYKRLVDKSQYYLLYRSIVSLLPVITFKMANAGVVKTPDEKVEVASQEQVSLEQSRYQAQADAECRKLQNYLLANAGSYPELDEHECHRIKAQLYSAATSGIFLGGARGKYLPNPAQ